MISKIFQLKYVLVLCLLLVGQSILAQLKYPIVGTYQKKSAQGMAIHDNIAYLMSDGGGCRIFDLKTGKMVRYITMDSAEKDNHINNACFGKKQKGCGLMPPIYITECFGKGRCFVELIDKEGGNSKLLQTIEANENEKNMRVTVWVVDDNNDCLYAITRNGKLLLDSVGNVNNHIIKYRLPNLEEGKNVILSEKDIIDSFDVIFANILQGCKIKGNYMYLVTGLQQSLSQRVDAKRAIQVIDLKKKKLVKAIDLTYVTTNEPEDIDFYEGRCLLYCGQEGGIYEIKLK